MGFQKPHPHALYFFHLSTFPFQSLSCITHHALNQILKKSHIFHKLHCFFMICKKICKGQFRQHFFRNHVPLCMVQLWHMPHPFHILLVSWEFLKSPQPFYFLLLHISAHILELQAAVWGINSSALVPPPPQTLCQETHNYPYIPLCHHVQNLLSPPILEKFHIFLLVIQFKISAECTLPSVFQFPCTASCNDE